MMWLLFVLCIAILLFVWFIIYGADDLETSKTLQGVRYTNTSKKGKFIENYKWCADNLTLRYSNLFEEKKNKDLSDKNLFDYHIVYNLSRSPSHYSFSELGEFKTRVTNGSGYDCYHVNEFYDEFNRKVETIRKILDQQDMSLYKKYKINYTNLLTDVLNKQ